MDRSLRWTLPLVAVVLSVVVWLVLGRGDGSADVARVDHAAASPTDRDRDVSLAPVDEAAQASTDRVATEAPESTPVEAPPTTAGESEAELRLVGRLLDAATDEPVPHAEIQVQNYAARHTVDASGRFDAEKSLRADDVLRVHDPFHGTHIRDARVGAQRIDADGALEVRIAIGPTTRFLLPPGAVGTAADWEARLVFAFGDEVLEQGWAPGRGDGRTTVDPGWFRYDNPMRGDAFAVEPDSIRVDARSQDGTQLASGRASSWIGRSPEITRLTLDREVGTVVGTIVDLAGEGVENVRVHALPSAAMARPWETPRPHETGTDDDGRFELRSLVPGAWRLFVVHGHHQVSRTVPIQVTTGRQTLDPIRLPLPSVVGDIRGRLVSEQGELPDYLHVSLRAQDGSRQTIDTAMSQSAYSWRLAHQSSSEERSEFPFSFGDLPAGTYELEVLDPSGARWSPPVATVQAPAEDVVFTRLAEAEIRTLRIEAFDAESGAELDQVTVRVERGGRELTTRTIDSGSGELRVAHSGALLFWVWASGYKMQLVQASGFQAKGGDLVARVELCFL